jgi:hypothetical protein
VQKLASPQLVRSSIERVRDPAQVIIEKMPVAVQGGVAVLWPSRFLQHLDVGPALTAMLSQVCRKTETSNQPHDLSVKRSPREAEPDTRTVGLHDDSAKDLREQGTGEEGQGAAQATQAGSREAHLHRDEQRRLHGRAVPTTHRSRASARPSR